MMDLVLSQAPAVTDLQVQSIFDFVVKGGVMMIPIGFASFVAFAVVVERLVSLRRRLVIPPSFIKGLTKVLREHPGDRERGLAYCQRNVSPVANVFAAGIKRLGAPIEVVQNHVQEAGQREVLKLRKFMRVLSVIAAITPLMGLLGTIFGMIRAFQTVATSAESLGKAEMLAGGIYEAMITTAAGLSVAIPVLICYHWLSAKIEKLVMEIDQMSVDFIEEHVEGIPVKADPPAVVDSSGQSAAANGSRAAGTRSVRSTGAEA